MAEKLYMNVNTGFIWTEEELKEQYEKQAHEEGVLPFEKMMKSMEEVNIDWFKENSNNGILTDGVDFYVDLGNGEGSAVQIASTKYADLLKGSETEFQEGIMDIDGDEDLWQELFGLYLEEKETNGYL